MSKLAFLVFSSLGMLIGKFIFGGSYIDLLSSIYWLTAGLFLYDYLITKGLI